MGYRDFGKLLASIAIFYDQESAGLLQELSATDPEGAYELAQAALHPSAIALKHEIDKSERAAAAAVGCKVSELP